MTTTAKDMLLFLLCKCAAEERTLAQSFLTVMLHQHTMMTTAKDMLLSVLCKRATEERALMQSFVTVMLHRNTMTTTAKDTLLFVFTLLFCALVYGSVYT
jgi:hypothetical protein